jgi:hypothetical protein
MDTTRQLGEERHADEFNPQGDSYTWNRQLGAGDPQPPQPLDHPHRQQQGSGQFF